MEKVKSIIRSFGIELLIVFSFMLLMNNFVGRTITGDGIGYYDYLPSIFIYKDISRLNFTENDSIAFRERTDGYLCYIEYDGLFVNRYPCGTAVLQSPFFVVTWLLTPLDGNKQLLHS